MAKQNETLKGKGDNNEGKNTPAVTLTPEKTTPTPTEKTTATVEVDLVETVRMVKVRGIENHDCRIGGLKYYVKKGQEQTIPEDAAMILAHRQIVITLGPAKK